MIKLMYLLYADFQRKVPSFHICSTQSCNLSFAIHKTRDNGQKEMQWVFFEIALNYILHTWLKYMLTEKEIIQAAPLIFLRGRLCVMNAEIQSLDLCFECLYSIVHYRIDFINHKTFEIKIYIIISIFKKILHRCYFK